MKKAARFLYKRACILGLPLFRRQQVEADLAQLHPGERVEYVKTEYYIKKLSLLLTILFAGAVLGLLARVGARRSAVLENAGAVERKSFEGEELWLEADDGESRRSFLVEVHPKEPTGEEAALLFETFLQNIETYILNGNEDLMHISTELTLKEEYEGFPFRVVWESSREDVIDSSGRVGEVDDPVALQLKLYMTCGEMEREEEISVVAVPTALSEEERDYRALKELLLETERENREKEMWELPEEWGGRELVWRLQAEDYSVLIWAAAPAVALLVYMFADRDLHRELEERRKGLRQEYPDLVYKLLLYVGAGMTVRGALKKIGGDYERKRREGGRRKPGCEEILYTCRELQGGVSEGAAYERLGKRAGVREYIRLGTLLGQNLKRGNSTLLDRLREEAEKSAEESLLQVKKLGEEAGTKLLLPMVLMLAVVMIVIMVPAFGTI